MKENDFHLNRNLRFLRLKSSQSENQIRTFGSLQENKLKFYNYEEAGH